MPIPLKWFSGLKIAGKDWNDVRIYKPYDYIMFFENSVYYAQGQFSGSTDYSGSDAAAVLQQVLNETISNSGSILIKQGNYTAINPVDIIGSDMVIEFEPGSTWLYDGESYAFRIGHGTETKRSRFSGNYCQITRTALGGTAGIVLEDAHLCTVDGFKINSFTRSGIESSGSWGSWIKHIEVSGTKGKYGLLLSGSDNNLFTVENSWFEGSVAAVGVLTTGIGISFFKCDFHDSPKGLVINHAYGLTADQSYFENLGGECIYIDNLNGTYEEDVAAVKILNSRLYASAFGSKCAIWANDISGLVIGGNTVDGDAGTYLLGVPNDTNMRGIYLTPENRLSLGLVSDFSGSYTSLAQEDHQYAIQRILLRNEVGKIAWLDSSNNPIDIMYLGLDNGFRIWNAKDKNTYIQNSGSGQIYIGVEATGSVWLGYGTGINKPEYIILNPKLSTQPRNDIIPDIDASYLLGNATLRFNAIHAQTFTGSRLYIWDIGTNLIPSVNNTKTLGTSSAYWKIGYITTINADTLSAPNIASDLLPKLPEPYNLGNDTHVWYQIYGRTLNITQVSSDVTPNADTTYDVGDPNKRWLNVYAYYITGSVVRGATANIGTINATTTNAGTLTATSVSSNLLPTSPEPYTLGNITHRWFEVWAKTVYEGDQVFIDKQCPICQKPFVMGEALVPYVIDVEEDGVRTIPAHLKCAYEKR